MLLWRLGRVAQAKFDYGELDRADSRVRLRLNSTVINASNTEDGVSVSYIRESQVLRVKARHCVIAGHHVIIPHLCPDLPAAQKIAQKYQIKHPLLMTNVLIRSTEAMDKLGIAGASCPGRMHEMMYLSRGMNTGGYRHEVADRGPVPVTFYGSISPPKDLVRLDDQCRIAMANADAGADAYTHVAIDQAFRAVNELP